MHFSHYLCANCGSTRLPLTEYAFVSAQGKGRSSMDNVVDAAHDRAQHSAASALATMGGPSASSSLPDLTSLSTDEVQMALQFVKHNNSMAVINFE